MKRLFIFLSALFALFLLQVAPAQAISLGSKTASAKGPDTLLIIQLDPNYVGKPGEIEKRIFDSFADEVKKAGHTVVPFAQAQKDLRIYLREEADTDTQREQDLGPDDLPEPQVAVHQRTVRAEGRALRDFLDLEFRGFSHIFDPQQPFLSQRFTEAHREISGSEPP